MDPAIGTIATSDTALVAEFSNDLNRKPLLLIDPTDRILRARPDPNIDLLLLE